MKPGQRVEALCATNRGCRWIPGVVLGTRRGFSDETFERIDVATDTGSVYRGCHPMSLRVIVIDEDSHAA